MRIIRGILKSRRFTVPKNFPSRPTTDFAKEGLFNMLENRCSLVDLNILDLCAGTGNISFEFLSREAGKITAVDKDFFTIRHIKKTAHELDIENNISVIKQDILQFLENTNSKYDIIFADPPYDYKFYNQLVEIINTRNLLTEDGFAVIEHGKRTVINDFPNFEFTRNYGNVYFSFFHALNEEIK